jgi:hypothetical protein
VPPPNTKTVAITTMSVVVTSTPLVSGDTAVSECDWRLRTRENAIAPRRPENHMMNCGRGVAPGVRAPQGEGEGEAEGREGREVAPAPSCRGLVQSRSCG